ncbi:MAG TPA: GAF domain-containing protein [Kouleothrix sp.]|nr:GAF domain-containing protein [Kouleothrix sp.]
MTLLFHQWLTEHRAELLVRWQSLVAEPVPLAASLQSTTHITAAEPVAIIDTAPASTLEQLYAAFEQAAAGDFSAWRTSLGAAESQHTSREAPGLQPLLGLIVTLRRAAWDVLNDPSQRPTDPQTFQPWSRLVEQLDQVIDQATVEASATWAQAASSVEQELHETKLLVESIYHDAEENDRTTMQVSNLNQLAHGLAASMDREQQLEIVGDLLQSTLDVATLSVWLVDAQNQALTLVRYWTSEVLYGAVTLPTPPHLPLEHTKDIIVRTFTNNDPVFRETAAPDEQGFWYQPGLAVFSVPMVAQGQVVGVIVLQDPSAAALSDRSQQDFVKSAASQAAIALENTRLYNEVLGFNSVLEQRIAERTQQLQIERDTLETVNQIALETSSTLDRDSLLHSSLNMLAKLVGVKYGSIMLVEQEIDHLIDCAVLGRRNDLGFTRLAIGQGIAGWVAQHKRPAIVPDVTKDPRWIPLPDLHGGTRKMSGSLIVVPLIAHHQVLGVLQLSHDDLGYFNEDHLRLLNASAGQIAIGINNAQLYTELEKELLHRSEMFQRQESEASQSQAILQSLSDGVIVCGEDGSVLAANMACERILERALEELVIWNLPELLRRLLGRRADEVPVEDLLERPIDEFRQPRSFATVFQLGTRTISITLGPVLNSKEALIGAVAVLRDITREVESDRLKTEFIGTVSHELRTPMTSIKGFTQLLSMGSLGAVNDTQKEFLEIIHSNAERMISIINDLLDITKIETGSVELDMRPIHLAEALSTVMLELQPLIRTREHTLAINIPPGLPLVLADSKRLNQILGNVLSNAVKYTQRGGQITLEAREVDLEAVPEYLREGLKPTRYALVEISDTGVGIATEDLHRIFERFYRTENPLKVEAGGTGLGLSLVRPLIELFGGRIWVRSTPDEGSTFSMVLPAA